MDQDETQRFFQIGGCAFHLTPVTILKCGLVTDDCVYGTEEELDEYRRLTGSLRPFLMSIANDTPPQVFLHAVQARIGSIIEMERLTSPLACGYARNLLARLKNQSILQKATANAHTFCELLTEWLQGTNATLINLAVELIQSYGVTPLLPSLGTVGNLGLSIGGRYQPALHTVAVQLDVLAGKSNPALRFLDALLHEQVHASIYQNLGFDPARQELEWLHELAAIATSHQAIVTAARALGRGKDIEASCCMLRAEQKHGDLAQSMLDSMPDPLIAWKIWQDVFLLPDEARRQYARREILSPILWERGWTGGLPFPLRP